MNRAVARRYAQALADIVLAAHLPVVQQRGEVRKAKQHLAHLATLLREQAALRNVLASPAVPQEQKLALLDRLRSLLGMSPISRNFVAVLIEHQRLEMLEQVLAAFDQEVLARLGIVPVEITTAISLTEAQKKRLEERLAALTGAQVEMRFQENPEVLAGGVARLGSTIYDGSLRAQLRRLQQQLTRETR